MRSLAKAVLLHAMGKKVLVHVSRNLDAAMKVLAI